MILIVGGYLLNYDKFYIRNRFSQTFNSYNTK